MNLVIGQDYYYLDSDGFAQLQEALSGTGINLNDNFPWYEVSQSGYAGYYFPIDEISDEEWDIMVTCSGFDTRAVWESVQAHYLGI